MSRRATITTASSPEEIYQAYSEMYEARDRMLRTKYGTDMYAAKLSKASLMIYIQGQRESERSDPMLAGRRWSMNQIVKNLVSKETSRFQTGSAYALIGQIRGGELEAPDEWKVDGKTKVPGVLELRAQFASGKLNPWLSQVYKEFKQEGERLNKEGRLDGQDDTPSKYAKHKISQYFFGSK